MTQPWIIPVDRLHFHSSGALVDAGAKAVGSLGMLVAAHVIVRPHEELLAPLPK